MGKNPQAQEKVSTSPWGIRGETETEDWHSLEADTPPVRPFVAAFSAPSEPYLLTATRLGRELLAEPAAAHSEYPQAV